LYNGVLKYYQVNMGKPFKSNEDQAQDGNPARLNAEMAAAVGEIILQGARKEAQMIIEKAKIEASAIIRNANEEKTAILNEATTKAKAEVEEIKRKARQEGYIEGKMKAEHQYKDMLMEAEKIRQNAIDKYNDVIMNMEPSIISLVLEIAQKVLDDYTESNREYLLPIIKQAVSRLSNKNNLVIRISEEDYPYVESNREKLMSMIEGTEKLFIKSDAALKRGACKVESPFGCVDAGLDTKMKEIENAFNYELAIRWNDV